MPDLRFSSNLVGHAWPPIPSPMGAGLLAMQYQFERSERMPPAERTRRQFAQLELLLAHAFRTMPFWQARLRQAGWQPGVALTPETWARLPVLTRVQVQEAGTDLHCQAMPEGHGNLLSASTSGSTGRPLTALKTDLSLFYWQATVLREALWHGMDVEAKLAVIRRDPDNQSHPPAGRTLPGWGPAIAAAIHTGKLVVLDVRSRVNDQLAWLIRENPAYVRTWPSNLLALARAAGKAGVRPPNLRAVATFGEAVGEELRAACRDAWGVDVIDAYSAEETGYIALQCPAGPQYHALDETVLVEVLDRAGAPCGPGQSGRVVLTPLHNYAMPLIRYEIGDYAETGGVPAGACRCGRTLPVLTRILGRARNQMLLSDGDRRFVNFGDFRAMAGGAGIKQFQLAQTAVHDLELRLVVPGGLTQVQHDAIVSGLRDRLGADFRVLITFHEEIPRSASGKYEDFICEVA